jgi:hypothetical protein
VVDYWLGTTSWRRLDAARQARVEQVLTADQPDPAELHKIDWELAAYWCRDCQRCYCRDDWQRPSSGTALSTTTPTASAPPGTAT